VLLSLKGNTPPAILALADGTVYIGHSIGAAGSTVGEVVFNTAMTGYQEILTDPSYCQQIVTLTYPHIGNYGVNPQDVEADKVHAAGLIIKDLPLLASNFRSTQTLSDYLVAEGTVAIANIDTRQLTRQLRTLGAQNGCILALADADFCAVVLRLATVFGCSPRMRFDLAINNMSYSAWKTGELPLMRSGRQWRPMVHVKDVARAVCFMLKAGREQVRGQIYNVGSEKNSFQLIQLAELVSASLSRTIEIEWYGDDDHRSYRVSFDKIEKLGYRAEVSAEDGIREIGAALETGKVEKSSQTLTLPWYQEIVKWQKIIHDVELCGGILDIENEENREGR